MKNGSVRFPNTIVSASHQSIGQHVADQLAATPGSACRSRQVAHCLWCGRIFTTRMTGGSAQRFCSTEHRKAFWTAARRWTMRAIETGLLSVDCLKGTQTSVHAAGGAFLSEREIRSSAT